MSDKKSEKNDKQPDQLKYTDVKYNQVSDIPELLDQAYQKAKKQLDTHFNKITGTLLEVLTRVGILENGYTQLEGALETDKADLNAYKQKTDCRIGGLEQKLQNGAYSLAKIDAKKVRFLYENAEVNLFNSPKQVYDEMEIEIPGTFSNVSKIELVYLNKDGKLYNKTRNVLETSTKDGKTYLNIGQYKLPSDAVKIGLGVYGQKLDDNTKGD